MNKTERKLQPQIHLKGIFINFVWIQFMVCQKLMKNPLNHRFFFQNYTIKKANKNSFIFLGKFMENVRKYTYCDVIKNDPEKLMKSVSRPNFSSAEIISPSFAMVYTIPYSVTLSKAIYVGKKIDKKKKAIIEI